MTQIPALGSLSHVGVIMFVLLEYGKGELGNNSYEVLTLLGVSWKQGLRDLVGGRGGDFFAPSYSDEQ